MPKGRKNLSPKEAKKQSTKKIRELLASNPEGLRFKDLKNNTGFHQSTISNNIKELITSSQVEYDPINRLYRLLDKGKQFYETRQLIDFIENSSVMILGTKGAASMEPVEDLILKSTTAYAYPAINPSILGYIKQDLNKLYLYLLLNALAKKNKIDPGYFTGELSLDGLVSQLREVLTISKQVLVFSIDHDVLRENVNVEYLLEVVAQKYKDIR